MSSTDKLTNGAIPAYVQAGYEVTPQQDYVAGFMFNQARDMVALIEKAKPEWQRGKLNGIGGKIEADENAEDAMVREFHEEANMVTVPQNWRHFCRMDGSFGTVHFFWSIGNLYQLRSVTVEPIRLVPVTGLHLSNVLPNLQWLIPMAQQQEVIRANVMI